MGIFAVDVTVTLAADNELQAACLALVVLSEGSRSMPAAVLSSSDLVVRDSRACMVVPMLRDKKLRRGER